MKQRILACILLALLAACATKKPRTEAEPDQRTRIVLPDGSECVQPDEYARLLSTEAAGRLREIFDATDPLPARIARLKGARAGYGEVDAAYFSACNAYAGGAVPKKDFEAQRTLWREARQVLLAEGVRKWIDSGSLNDAGKLCLAVFGKEGKEGVDARNTTRLVPGDVTVDDCSLMASKAGAEAVLLGCTDGRWANRWAAKPVATGPEGRKDRKLRISGTDYVPEKNCAWN